MTQKCDLCAGVCRGHGLGNDESWKPEIGSRAYAETAMTQSIEEAAREIAASIIAQKGSPLESMILRGLCDEKGIVEHPSDVIAAALAGIKLGREQAARVANSMKYGDIAHDAETESHDDACNTIAQAIRTLP